MIYVLQRKQSEFKWKIHQMYSDFDAVLAGAKDRQTNLIHVILEYVAYENLFTWTVEISSERIT